MKLSNLMRTKSKSNRIESKSIESKSIESNRNQSNRIEINRIETNRTESKTRKNFLILKVLELREIFERNRIETKSIEFRVRIKFEGFTVNLRTKSGFRIEPNSIESIRFCHGEPNQTFSNI